jgi:hypothetical protein
LTKTKTMRMAVPQAQVLSEEGRGEADRNVADGGSANASAEWEDWDGKVRGNDIEFN